MFTLIIIKSKDCQAGGVPNCRALCRRVSRSRHGACSCQHVPVSCHTFLWQEVAAEPCLTLIYGTFSSVINTSFTICPASLDSSLVCRTLQRP